ANSLPRRLRSGEEFCGKPTSCAGDPAGTQQRTHSLPKPLPRLAIMHSNTQALGEFQKGNARRVPVLIVGGGPVGLALAAELGLRGIRCELIEQTDGAISAPKINEVNTRTMEFCRRWGVADAVLNCPFPKDHARDVVFVTSLAGYELGRIRRPASSEQKP